MKTFFQINFNKIQWLLLASLICFVNVLKADDGSILKRVPSARVPLVLTINSGVMNKKMSNQELEKLQFMHDMMVKSLHLPDSADATLDMYGIDFNAQSVFFIEFGDSAVLFNYVFKIADVEKFKTLFKGEDSIKVDVFGNYYVEQYSNLIAWNNQYGVFVNAEVNAEYRYANAYDYDDYAVDTTVAEEEYSYEMPDSSYTTPDGELFNYADTVAAVATYEESEEDAYYEELKEQAKDKTESYDYVSSYEDEGPSLAILMCRSQYQRLLAGNQSPNILDNSKFTKSYDDQVDMLMWAGMEKEYTLNMMKESMGSYFYKYVMPVNSPLFSEENYMVAKLIFEKDGIKSQVISHLDKRMSKSYKKIYRSKISKKMINSIKGDNVFGFLTSATDSKEAWKQTPDIWKNYLKLNPYTNDIADEVVDLIFLFLDTKSISKLFKGNIMVAFTGMVTKEVPFVTYEYDSSFTMVPVEKTRMQSHPEFVGVYNTSDPENTKKFLSIFVKKGMLSMDIKQRYYYTQPFMEMLPFQLYFVVKRNAVYVCNSESQLDVILRGKNKDKMKKEYRKMIRKNTFTCYADIKNIVDAIQSSEDSISEPAMDVAQRYAGNFTITSKGVRGNSMLTEAILSTPSQFKNSLEAFYSVMNEFYLVNKEEEKKPTVSRWIEVEGTQTLHTLTQFVTDEYYTDNEDAYIYQRDNGTGAAFESFSTGFADIIKTARPISAKEDSVCASNKIEYLEFPIAYDGIVFIVNSENTWLKSITMDEIKKIWGPEAKGTITKWNQVRKEWPNETIQLYGHGNSSAYYNYLATAIDKNLKLRSDYIIESDNELLVNWIGKNKYSFGFVRMTDYINLKTKVKVVPVDDQIASNGKGAFEFSEETLAKGQYPFARVLYLYANKKSLNKENVNKYVTLYLNKCDELISKSECIQLPKAVSDVRQDRLTKLVTGSEWLKKENKGKINIEEIYK